ncbi:MAG TPA: hypothetical protein VE954_32425 [Oligoflexus sp.]|uniref:hypothetical protein n=1 Tax=Oligoflexus sp. TaxID=1971216 RepID=UPI002D27F3D7|nr:hypothetical protein [Oligoflexus sp.]HYX37834.1 hypothetical protein [Oligoflexus sp.]
MQKPGKIARSIDGGSTGGFGVSVLTSDGQVGGSGTSGGGGSSGCAASENNGFATAKAELERPN